MEEKRRVNQATRCDTCHNEYDKTFDVVMNGNTYTFDSFECAIHLLATIVAAVSSVMAWKATVSSIVVTTVPKLQE
jgi:hypothetical protein